MHQPAQVHEHERRTFLQWISYGLLTVAGMLVAVPFIGFIFGARKRDVQWIKLGPTGDFAQGETRLKTFENLIREPWDGITAQTGVFVRYQGKDTGGKDQFLVLAVNCAHLGCPVSWFPQSGLFMCPCHGGVYYASGERASGPPPQGLFHCAWQIADGQLEIQAPHYPTLHDPLDAKVKDVSA